jgi:hypothetical protein
VATKEGGASSEAAVKKEGEGEEKETKRTSIEGDEVVL